MTLVRVPLEMALEELASELGLELVVDRAAVAGLEVTLRLQEGMLANILDDLEDLFPIRIERSRARLRVSARTGPRLALLVYPVAGGLVDAEDAQGFESLAELSFISRSQSAGRGGDEPRLRNERPSSHLERWLEKVDTLVPWAPGSAWFLDRRRNLLLVRATSEALDQIEVCLERLTATPVIVEIETRFVEVSEGVSRELGAELGLTDDSPLHRNDLGFAETAVGADSGTRLGLPPLVPGGISGANLSILGVLSQPRFKVLLRALASEEQAEVLSAPSVTTVNNSRATIAITRNLPFVEGYQPVFDRRVVAGDGITETEANVALVATINDENFTGIVLNVTPSVGSDLDTIHLRVEPVIRDQVDSIVISSGALVEGVPTPVITRPIIETRVIHAQLKIPNGSTIVMGGLKATTSRRQVFKVPVLGSIPWIGRLFRRETEINERRDLLILVTARVVAR